VARWYAGYGTPLMADALVRHRDGIVGTWVPLAAFPGNELPLEGAASALANLLRWEPWVRAAVYDFEIFSKLQFTQPRKEPGAAVLWHVDDTDVTSDPPTNTLVRLATMLRPPKEVFVEQLNLVNGYADLREDRASEIIAQLDAPLAFWSSVVNLHPDRRRWTLELLAAAIRLAGHAEMRFKHALACRRPVELSPQIQPMVLTPMHGALPSGHSCEAFVAAYVLWRLIADPTPQRCGQLLRQAARIAINRQIAGVHYPVDSAAGQLLGLVLGEYFVARCTGGEYQHRRFKGPAYDTAANRGHDFDWRELANEADAKPPAAAPFFADVDKATTVKKSPILEWLWKRAHREWVYP
jgi:hypothetical protein